MKPYYAGIKQSPDTIKRFSRVQFNIFRTKTKLAVISICVGFLVIGLSLLNTAYKALAVVLVFLACLIYANQDAGADYTANTVIEMFQGNFPKLKYAFYSSGFSVHGNGNADGNETKYSEIIRLVEDDEYLYLFQTEQYGVMIRSSTVTGEGGLQGLKDLLAQKTKLKWTKQNRFLTFSMSSQLGMRGKPGIGLSSGGHTSLSELLFGKRSGRL